MSQQGETWIAHTKHYLRGVDPALEGVFDQAMDVAGFPRVSAAEAMEAICADFLAGCRPVSVNQPHGTGEEA